MTPTEEFLIKVLLILEKGCSSHYYYKGNNTPTVPCEKCKEVYEAMRKWRTFRQANNL